MDELIGKGLSIWLILELLALMSTTLVPLALPLGVLTAAIMTFSNLGENFELVAMKSSGISLLRIMRPLFLFIILISLLGFVFNNNVIPVANLKALSLLYDMRNSKPALNIQAGQFNNNIPGFSIRVGKKDKDGRTIHDIIIYDRGQYNNQNKMVIARKGEMFASADKKYMVFRLEDGWRYEDGAGAEARQSQQFLRMHFKRWDKIFDLSALQLTRTNEDMFKNAYQMMNVAQLNGEIDSMQKLQVRMVQGVYFDLKSYVTFWAENQDAARLREQLKKPLAANRQRMTDTGSFLQIIPDSLRHQTRTTTATHIRFLKVQAERAAIENKIRQENILKYDIEWHRKFTLSVACVLLFLIGAPLGAIIRKGGMGMPMIVAIIFFLIWYIVSITGEKVSKSGSTPPWVGMWVSAVLLLPIAAFLIVQARNDSRIFSKEWYSRIGRAFIKVFKKSPSAI
jgi:lipopolysaccharide export system permease protein